MIKSRDDRATQAETRFTAERLLNGKPGSWPLHGTLLLPQTSGVRYKRGQQRSSTPIINRLATITRSLSPDDTIPWPRENLL